MDRTIPLIFVVEDDTEIRALLVEILSDTGYEVLGCAAAREAQYLINIEPPDLLLLDIHLEEHAAGWHLLTWVRERPETAELPVIVCSVDGQFLRMRSQENQAQHCFMLEKPFELDELLTTVYATIGVGDPAR